MTMTLGEVRDALANAPKDARVVFWPFEYLYWDGIDSWRGSYDEPAVGYSTGSVTAAWEALAQVEAAMSGARFEGYKGGTYYYNARSVLHVDSYGEYTDGLYIDRIDVSDPYEVRVHLKRESER